MATALYSPSLEKGNSEFLGSNSSTPSPTSYKDTSDTFLISRQRQPYPLPLTESASAPLLSNDSQPSPPPSVLRSPQLEDPLQGSRPRGHSASARPTLRLHIANPTEPPPSKRHIQLQEESVRSTIDALRINAQSVSRSLYPSSVGGGSSNGNSPIRKRGETFSNFSTTNLSSPASTTGGTRQPLLNSRSASPPVRLATDNLNYATSAGIVQLSNSSLPPSSGSASSATNYSTKRPYRASPLIGPQAMAVHASSTPGTNSSVSTASGSIFTDDYYPSASSVSTPATQESALEYSNHLSPSSRLPMPGTGVRNRPLPVPPPPSATITPAAIPTLSTISSQVSSPLSPHLLPRPMTPSIAPSQLAQHAPISHGHNQSYSGEFNSDDPSSADLAYRMEKRRGKQPANGGGITSCPPATGGLEEEETPYELRSEKWKGKQKMRDSAYETLNSPQLNSFSATFPPVLPPPGSNTDSLEDLGLPPSLSGTLSNRPSRASISSSHSSTRSIGGVNEGGVSKWKGKGKEVMKNLSISSLSSLDSSGKGQELRKSGSIPSFSKPGHLFQSDSPASSFSASPVVPPPSIPASVSSPVPVTGAVYPPQSVLGPRTMMDAGSIARSSSPRAVGRSAVPMYAELPLPLNIRKVSSPVTSPTLPPLPPKNPHRVMNQLNSEVYDSDEEGQKLYKEVEAAYVSGTRPIDTGYGYAEVGYEDDERVYVDDGYDPHDGLDDLDKEYGFGVSASGQLVGGGGVSIVPQPKQATAPLHNMSRVSISSRERSPSPMRYARRRRDSLFEDDDYDSPESNGMISPVDPKNLPPPTRPQINTRSLSPAGHSGFVYVEKSPPSGSSPLVNSATHILSALNPRGPPSSTSSNSTLGSALRARERRQQFDTVQVLGAEPEMSFARNPSPTRYHRTRGVAAGPSAVLAEDKVYVQGKWRMRSPSPGVSPVGPTEASGQVDGGGGTARVKGANGGLRRYASEESLLSAGIVSAETEESVNSGAGFAPLRSNRFEEFNLPPKRFVDRIPTPDSMDSYNPNRSKKSLSTQSSSSGRQTPMLRGSGTKPQYADDLGFGVGWKGAAEVGREGKSMRRKKGVDEKEQKRERIPAKLEKKKPSVQRGTSASRSGGNKGEVERNRSIRRQPSSEYVSYDLWVERGLEQASAAVKGKKTSAFSKIV